MKKILSAVLIFAVLLSSSFVTFAATGESGAYNPVTLDEIQKGTVIAFDSEGGAFNTTTYYVKLLGSDGEEYIYALADRVILSNVLYDAEEIAGMDLGEITFVLRSGKIKYINPVMPDGLFERVEVTYCYMTGDKIYADVEFQNIVDEFKLIMAVYNEDNILCSVKSFDISYTDSYYELAIDANGGDKVKLFYLYSEDSESLKPVCEATAVEPLYISNKKIMTVERGVKTVDGYKITGYSEGKKVIFVVDATKEPIVEEVFADKIIAYVPDGDTIKDIEIVFSVPSKHNEFTPQTGASFIKEDTKETVIFGLAEYSTSKITVNGVDYTTNDDTNYLLMEYGYKNMYYGIGKRTEMNNEYVLIRVKEDKPTVICDAIIFQGLN